MATNRRKAKGRRDSGSFVALPHAVLECEAYAKLGGWSVRLLLDLFSQYRGHNNGDFSIVWPLMKGRGWRSKDTLYSARDELNDNGFIVLTRQGGKHQCSLYGVTWLGIDECGGKLDWPSSSAPLGYWKRGKPPILEVVPRIRTTLAR
jgi:hypothetical protein